MPDFSVKENQDILIKDSVIAQIRDTAETGEAKETIDGKGNHGILDEDVLVFFYEKIRH